MWDRLIFFYLNFKGILERLCFVVKKGSGPEIPVHLRTEGKVKNKNFSKKDALKILTDFLKDRMQKDSVNLNKALIITEIAF